MRCTLAHRPTTRPPHAAAERPPGTAVPAPSRAPLDPAPARPPAGLQSEPGRVAELRQFIEHALQQPDVWFVTNQQLLAWMQNPVPASRLASQLKCHRPTDISPHVGPVCDTYVG